MKVKDLMTTEVAWCLPDSSLREVARMMVDWDCGEIPVVDDRGSMRPVGVVTDRDIAVRAVAEGRDPRELTAGGCMTSPAVTCGTGDNVTECTELMQRHKIRRVPIVDDQGRLCGIVAQADIARHAAKTETIKVVKEVSASAPVLAR
jgi:CBS domain-containing protein